MPRDCADAALLFWSGISIGHIFHVISSSVSSLLWADTSPQGFCHISSPLLLHLSAPSLYYSFLLSFFYRILLYAPSSIFLLHPPNLSSIPQWVSVVYTHDLYHSDEVKYVSSHSTICFILRFFTLLSVRLSVLPSYRFIYHLTISQGDLARDYLHLLPQSLSSTSGNLKGLIPIENFTHFFLPDSILGSTISFFQPSIFFTFTPGCHFPSFPSIGLLIGTFRFFFHLPNNLSICLSSVPSSCRKVASICPSSITLTAYCPLYIPSGKSCSTPISMPTPKKPANIQIMPV